jgi:hypothetical protein
VNLVWGALIVLGVTAVAVTAMLVVRRRAPEGSYFKDGDRASGVFGVLATGFSVLLGFIIFLAFTSYDQSRIGAETEALTVVQQVEDAQLFPTDAAATLTGQLMCYARSVVNDEWARMENGTQEDVANPWALEMFSTIRGVEPKTARQQSAYDKWLELTSTREEARRDRLHGAAGVIPSPLWLVLALISLVIFVYMLFFAYSSEGAVTQGLLMGGVTAVITTMLLLLVFLDDPFHSGVGGLQPIAMERSQRVLDQALPSFAPNITPPCDVEGRAL